MPFRKITIGSVKKDGLNKEDGMPSSGLMGFDDL